MAVNFNRTAEVFPRLVYPDKSAGAQEEGEELPKFGIRARVYQARNLRPPGSLNIVSPYVEIKFMGKR